MQRSKPENLDRPKHPDAQRDAMEDIQELASSPRTIRNDIKYVDPNRDRALGDADRTGRHFDESPAENEETDENEESGGTP